MLQLLLGAAIIGCGFVGVYWPGSADSFLGILGLLIALAGAASSSASSHWDVRSRPCHDRAGRPPSTGSLIRQIHAQTCANYSDQPTARGRGVFAIFNFSSRKAPN